MYLLMIIISAEFIGIFVINFFWGGTREKENSNGKNEPINNKSFGVHDMWSLDVVKSCILDFEKQFLNNIFLDDYKSETATDNKLLHI